MLFLISQNVIFNSQNVIFNSQNVIFNKKPEIIPEAKIGENFGKLGTYVGENHPKLQVNWEAVSSKSHAFERMTQRGVSVTDVEYFIENGKILEQSGGKYAYITEKGMAVLSPNGTLITTYSSSYYDETMKEVVKKLFGK